MSWTEIAVIGPGPLERIFRRSMNLRRALGFKSEHAMEDTAHALDTTPRRVRGLLRGEVFKVAADEYRRALHRGWGDVDRQVTEIEFFLIKMKKESESEWTALYQLELPLGDRQRVSSPQGSVYGERG